MAVAALENDSLNWRSNKVEKLFLVGDQDEYRKAAEFPLGQEDVILFLSRQPPYLTDAPMHLPLLQSWTEFGVENLDMNRYWLENYKEIEEIISMRMRRFCQNPLFLNPHFAMDLVWQIGDSYYKYADVLKSFFKKHCPKELIFTPKDDFVSELILAHARRCGIHCRGFQL